MKRRWFQIHLATCIIMMVVFGVIVGLNCIRHEHYTKRSFPENSKAEFAYYYYGWLNPVYKFNDNYSSTHAEVMINILDNFFIDWLLLLAAAAYSSEKYYRKAPGPTPRRYYGIPKD